MKRAFAVGCFALLLICAQSAMVPGAAAQTQSAEVVEIDARAATTPLPHFWEQMFGSGRAILSLRESYRRDLREVKQATGVQYIRFHGIFMDEVGVYDEDAQGNPIYNFSYVDQIYDGLLENGVRPFVELSFMPKKLAAKDALHPFWYKQNVAPPKDWNKWSDFIHAFTAHLVERYGEQEVAKWYFEVWNEPNIDFWAGDPKQETYLKLYDVTVAAIKGVSPKLRVGGPATAQAAWADVFIRHCVDDKVPVDFITTHVYGNDRSQDVFGTDEVIARDQMVCRAVRKVHDQIAKSALPHLPLIWSEFNASYKNERDVTDATYIGPWMADTIRQCDGAVDMLSYWTFSDVFEEQGVVKEPMYGGFGLIAAGSVPKPAFNAFRLLHQLGDQRLPVKSDSVLATRSADGLAVAVWNLVNPGGEPWTAKRITLRFRNVGAARAFVSVVDTAHGDVNAAYEKMGKPRYPTAAQLKQLQKAAQMPAPTPIVLNKGEITLELAPNALVLVELKQASKSAAATGKAHTRNE